MATARAKSARARKPPDTVAVGSPERDELPRTHPAFKGWVPSRDGEEWTDPFERKRKVLAASPGTVPSGLLDAAIYVNDTLDVAVAIALNHFGAATPEAVLGIYRVLVERHAFEIERRERGLDEE